MTLMDKTLFILFLLLTLGCGGGYYSGEPYPESKKFMPQPVYNVQTGRTEWVNPMPFTVREGRRPTYMNYDTGEVYVPLQGPGNFYMNSGGDLIQPY